MALASEFDDNGPEFGITDLELPDWGLWYRLVEEKGIEDPADEDLHFGPLVHTRFPKITKRGWRSMFGVSEEVLESIWRIYWRKLLFYGVSAQDLLWMYHRLSTASSWDLISVTWNIPGSTIYNKASFALFVCATVFDEVRLAIILLSF